LAHWPTSQRDVFWHRLAQAEGRFAVFDADNTLWQHDLVEALLAWLEKRGLLSLLEIPHHHFPVAPLQGEGVLGYYWRIHERSIPECYRWASLAFDGFLLSTILAETHKMMAHPKPIVAQLCPQRGSVSVPIPKIFPQQVALLRFLESIGVTPWSVSASLEELVRLVATDPRYGIHLPREHIIGVHLTLKKEKGPPSDATFTGKLRPPLTWYEGKVAAIQEKISPKERPILVAGDSNNDLPMQRYGDPAGIRLRIHSVPEKRAVWLKAMQAETPDASWVEVQASDLV
jgi:phosphoserine phosphatase